MQYVPLDIKIEGVVFTRSDRDIIAQYKRESYLNRLLKIIKPNEASLPIIPRNALLLKPIPPIEIPFSLSLHTIYTLSNIRLYVKVEPYAIYTVSLKKYYPNVYNTYTAEELYTLQIRTARLKPEFSLQMTEHTSITLYENTVYTKRFYKDLLNFMIMLQLEEDRLQEPNAKKAEICPINKVFDTTLNNIMYSANLIYPIISKKVITNLMAITIITTLILTITSSYYLIKNTLYL